MKIKDLIKELKKYPKNVEVIFGYDKFRWELNDSDCVYLFTIEDGRLLLGEGL